MPVDDTYRIISVHPRGNIKEMFIITGINEKEFHKIKHGEDLHIKRGNTEFDVLNDNVLCFGEIDYNEGSEDCIELNSFTFLDHLWVKGVCIPSRYDYKTHTCKSPLRQYLYTETFKNATLCRYLHGCLGKPQFSLIFREVK